MNVFEDVLKEATMHGEGFRVADVVELFEPLKNFNFEQWREKGTGNKAETDAARDGFSLTLVEQYNACESVTKVRKFASFELCLTGKPLQRIM